MRCLMLLIALTAPAAIASADVGDPSDPLGLNARSPSAHLSSSLSDWDDLVGFDSGQRGTLTFGEPEFEQVGKPGGLGHPHAVPSPGPAALLVAGSVLAARRRR